MNGLSLFILTRTYQVITLQGALTLRPQVKRCCAGGMCERNSCIKNYLCYTIFKCFDFLTSKEGTWQKQSVLQRRRQEKNARIILQEKENIAHPIRKDKL
jgi:hypothetical protein